MTLTHRRSRVCAALAVLLLAGCVSGKDAGMEPTMDTRQATYRVETHIKDTLAQLPKTARLTPVGSTDSLPCDSPDDGGSENRVIVEYSYFIDGLPRENNREYFDTVERYWVQRGFRKIRKDLEKQAWSMVYTDAEGFRLRLGTSVEGYLHIRSQSPCIWPNGQPE